MYVCIGNKNYIDKNGNKIYLYYIGETIEENGEGYKYMGTCKSKTKLDINPLDQILITFRNGQYGWYIKEIRKENN